MSIAIPKSLRLPEPIRIISDLHFGYPGSLARTAEQFRPLLDGAGTLVFNGDTAELRAEGRRPAARRELDRLRGLCAEAGVQTVFVNGNHDPTISEVNHLDLADGAVLVTHGDILFTDLAPWCRESLKIGEAHRRMIDAADDDLFSDFEARLRLLKEAIVSVGLPELRLDYGRLARLAMFARNCWPPTTPFKILRCWREAPRRAATLARIFRPRARFVIIGHFHLSSIARTEPRIVINTGSFTPYLGRQVVDIENGTLSVRRIDHRQGCFSPGREVARYPIEAVVATEA